MSKAIEDMDYAELQAEAKRIGVAANGNKEAILDRIASHVPVGVTEGQDTNENEQEEEGAAEEEVAAEETPMVVETPRVVPPDSTIEKAARTDAQNMKQHLMKQPKVSIMIPLEVGVAPEVAEKIPFIVNINGYRLSIKRGTFVEVPKQIADMVKDRLESEGKVGRSARIDRDVDTLDALG
jgi:hypothetical protein